MRHNTGGHEYLVDPASFLHGSRCPVCNRKILGDLKRKTHSDFIKACIDLVGEEYKVISEYHATHLHVKLRHKECGNEFNVMPSSFLKGGGCPKCKGKKLRQKYTMNL